MALRRFRGIQTNNRDLQLVQQQISETLDAVVDNPTNSAALISKVNITAGSNLISHGLGRAYLSFFVGRLSAATTIIEGTSPDRTKFLVVSATAPCTCDFLVL